MNCYAMSFVDGLTICRSDGADMFIRSQKSFFAKKNKYMKNGLHMSFL